MRFEEYLSQACILDKQIDKDIKELDQIKKASHAMSSRSQNCHSIRQNSSDLYARENSLKEKIDSEIDNLVDIENQIMSLMSPELNQNERLILQYRFLTGMPWKDIEKELNINGVTSRKLYEFATCHMVISKDPVKISLSDFIPKHSENSISERRRNA